MPEAHPALTLRPPHSFSNSYIESISKDLLKMCSKQLDILAHTSDPFTSDDVMAEVNQHAVYAQEITRYAFPLDKRAQETQRFLLDVAKVSRIRPV